MVLLEATNPQKKKIEMRVMRDDFFTSAWFMAIGDKKQIYLLAQTIKEKVIHMIKKP